MKKIKYFFEFIIIAILFLIFKLLGLKFASYVSGKLGHMIGPLFRSKKIVKNNIFRALPNLNALETNQLIKNMWNNYGRILSEYMFLKTFRSAEFRKNLIIEGQEVLDKIKTNNEPVIFISGHFNNYELMTMQIDKSGINVAAIYRPLNNIFMKILQDKIREKYICKNYIKKGISGVRQLLSLFKKGYSIAIMIDQRVREGVKIKFFGDDAYTTTMPAQFVKKFNCKVVPIYIKRINGVNFKIKINKPLEFKKEDSIEKITLDLNLWLEKMILHKPEQWIWTHNRWKQ